MNHRRVTRPIGEGPVHENLANPAQRLLQARKIPVWAGAEASTVPLGIDGIQAKLTVNQSGDRHEREADSMADQVVRMTESSEDCRTASSTVGRSSSLGSISGTSQPGIQRDVSARSGTAEAPLIVHEALNTTGAPIDDGTRSFMERRFGEDFSEVQILDNAKAVASAEAVRAKAYTVGQTIVFGQGQYLPETTTGRRLLAHELSHVVQQRSAGGSSPAQLMRDEDTSETGATADDKSAAPAVDKRAGTQVSEIIADTRRGRVGFVASGAQGWILGSVDTDLPAGTYLIRPELTGPEAPRWVIEQPAVREGLRFHVELTGADPWTLAYPDTLKLHVGATSEASKGSTQDMFSLLQLMDEMAGLPDLPAPKTDLRIDAFEFAMYDIDYRSQGGNASKWFRASFSDLPGMVDINIDWISGDVMTPDEVEQAWKSGKPGVSGRILPDKMNRSTTPRLWEFKQRVLKNIDDYNVFMMTAYFVHGVWPILTMGVSATPATQLPQRRPAIRPGALPSKSAAPGSEPLSAPGSEPATPTPKTPTGAGQPPAAAPSYAASIGEQAEPVVVQKYYPKGRLLPPKFKAYDAVEGGTVSEQVATEGSKKKPVTVINRTIKGGRWISIKSVLEGKNATPENVERTVNSALKDMYNDLHNPTGRLPSRDPTPVAPNTYVRVIKSSPDRVTLHIELPGQVTPEIERSASDAVKNSTIPAELPAFDLVINGKSIK